MAPALVERVLAKLGLGVWPSPDLAGLNALLAACCGAISFDNVQKRIWFAGDQTRPLTGGDPTEFFENWLRHGTGGTCWPFNGAMYALARAAGFDDRRITGSVIVEGYPQGANHGSVLVTLEGRDYLFDANFGAFEVLLLAPGQAASTGQGIHDIRAVPVPDGFEILWYAGHNREEPLRFRTEPQHDPVDHAFFLARYDRTKKVGFFNDTLYICCRFPDRILTLGRGNKMTVAPDGTFTKTEVTAAGRKTALIEEFGLSEQIVEALPPDVPGGAVPF